MRHILIVITFSFSFIACKSTNGGHRNSNPHNKSIINSPEKIKIIDKLNILKMILRKLSAYLKIIDLKKLKHSNWSNNLSIWNGFNFAKVFEKVNIINSQDIEQRVLFSKVKSCNSNNDKSFINYKVGKLWTKNVAFYYSF